MNTVGHTSVPRQFKEWNLPTRCCIRRSPGPAAAESEHAAEWGWSGQCSCMPFSGPPYGCFTLRYSLIPHCEICYLSCDCLDSIKALTSLHLSSFPLLLQLCCWWGWWFRMLKDGVFSSTFADLEAHSFVSAGGCLLSRSGLIKQNIEYWYPIEYWYYHYDLNTLFLSCSIIYSPLLYIAK